MCYLVAIKVSRHLIPTREILNAEILLFKDTLFLFLFSASKGL
jgi:hypothetical protein